ncbi:nucleolin isoform X3 [Dicentrarchus labrax]|uniref:nucleolin isoform X3 n=1 Tax=Dicentrarchus labrax TaxID=13489 RepID=UPI0021F5A717|nr:nucleolin isoform X3 [Dicentrarchus labrax]
MATRRSKRQSKVVTNEVVEGEDSVKTEEQIVGKDEGSPTEMKPEENQDEQDSPMDAVIEVKGTKSTVTVSWDKKNEEGEVDDTEKRTDESGQMMDTGHIFTKRILTIHCLGRITTHAFREEQTQIISSADAVGSTEDNPGKETKMEKEVQESGETQVDVVAGEDESTPTVTVTWEKTSEEGEQTDGDEQIVKETAVNGKRKAPPSVETSPSKKTKLINDGFCLFVGNLNNSKTFEEVKNSLANYFMTQSLLVQDIRLHRSKKHAFVDLASQMDLTKALTLNGEMILEKPMKIAKAKVKSEDMVKVKASAEEKKAAKDAKCLFLKNVPYNATKQDILKIFRKAVGVRFPGGSVGPDKGIAFVEFKNKTIAKKVQQKKQVAKIQDRVLIVDRVGEANATEVTKANDDNNNNNNNDNNTQAAAPPNNTLFVSNLSYNVKEKNLKNVFQKAVSIKMPQSKGKSKGFAFVEFATVEDAEKALKSTQNIKISKREVRVKFCEVKEKTEKAKVLSKTLIVVGLAEKTTAETLKSAFEGALSARVIADKETGVSRRFGFVDFESDENCKAVKEAMEDCEIDGSKVTVAYAKAKAEQGAPAARGRLTGHRGGKLAGKGRGAGRLQAAVKGAGNKK